MFGKKEVLKTADINGTAGPGSLRINLYKVADGFAAEVLPMAGEQVSGKNQLPIVADASGKPLKMGIDNAAANIGNVVAALNPANGVAAPVTAQNPTGTAPVTAQNPTGTAQVNAASGSTQNQSGLSETEQPDMALQAAFSGNPGFNDVKPDVDPNAIVNDQVEGQNVDLTTGVTDENAGVTDENAGVTDENAGVNTNPVVADQGVANQAEVVNTNPVVADQGVDGAGVDQVNVQIQGTDLGDGSVATSGDAKKGGKSRRRRTIRKRRTLRKTGGYNSARFFSITRKRAHRKKSANKQTLRK